MTSSARIRRGFRRLGIAVSVSVFLIGMTLAFITGAEHATNVVRNAEHHNCVLERWRANPFSKFDDLPRSFQAKDCPKPWETVYLTNDAKPMPVPDWWSKASPVWTIGTAWSLVVALIPLVVFMTLGWIIAGFMRDEQT